MFQANLIIVSAELPCGNVGQSDLYFVLTHIDNVFSTLLCLSFKGKLVTVPCLPFCVKVITIVRQIQHVSQLCCLSTDIWFISYL